MGDCPLIVQFAANDARLLSDAARIVCPYANGIDINCSLPSEVKLKEVGRILKRLGKTSEHGKLSFWYSKN